MRYLTQKKIFFNYTGESADSLISYIICSLKRSGIYFTTKEYGLISEKIPIPLMSFDSRLYSKNNFLGVNPFVFVDKILITRSANGVYVDVTFYRPYVFIALGVFLFISARNSVEFSSHAYWLLVIGLLFFFFIRVFIIGITLNIELKNIIKNGKKKRISKCPK